MDNTGQLKDFMQIYHPNCLLDDRQKALINDIIPLFTQAESIESEISFPLFKSLWKDYRLQYLTSCLHKKEDKKEFVQLFYGVLLNKLIQSSNFNVQTVCVMGIFTLYSTQSEFERERINLDIESLQKLKSYFSSCSQKQQTQGADILKMLLTKDAFIITQKRGIKTIILDKFGYPLKKNTFFEAENICGFSQMPQMMDIESHENNSENSDEEDEDNQDKEQNINFTDADELIELLGINDLKEASNEYSKQKNKKRDIINKVSESDIPFYDQIKKDFVGKFSHDINQVDQFFASRTETRIQRQLNQNNNETN